MATFWSGIHGRGYAEPDGGAQGAVDGTPYGLNLLADPGDAAIEYSFVWPIFWKVHTLLTTHLLVFMLSMD
jgi:hypothetical protein